MEGWKIIQMLAVRGMDHTRQRPEARGIVRRAVERREQGEGLQLKWSHGLGGMEGCEKNLCGPGWTAYAVEAKKIRSNI